MKISIYTKRKINVMLYIEEDESLFFSILKVVARVYKIAYPFVLKRYLNIKDDILNNNFDNKKCKIKQKFLHSNILLNGQCHFTDAMNVFILCEVFKVKLIYSNNICSILLLEYKGIESARINIKLKFCNDNFISEVINTNIGTSSNISYVNNYNRNILLKKICGFLIKKEAGLLFSVRKIKDIKAVRKIYSFYNNNPIYDKNKELSTYILGGSPVIKNTDIDGLMVMYRLNEIEGVFKNGIDINIRKNYKVLNKNFVFVYNDKRKKLKETNSINFTFLDTSIGALPFYIINPNLKNDDMFLIQIVEIMESFKSYYENILKDNMELYLRYKRDEMDLEDNSLFKIKVLAGYESLFFSFLNNNSICKANGFFCYTEKFGCKNMFGDQKIEDIVKKVTSIFGSKNIKNVFLDLACPYFPNISNIDPHIATYVSFKKDSFYSISTKIKPYFYLLNTNLAAANIKFFKKIGNRIRKFGFLYKLNFYNPTLKHVLKDFIKNVTFPKKAFLSTFLSICSSKYKSNLFIDELLNVKANLEDVKTNNSEYRMEIKCKFIDLYQGLGFLSSIKTNRNNFILTDWNKIYDEIIKTLNFIIDFVSHKKYSYVEHVFYSIFFEVYLKNIIFTGRFGGSAIFADNDLAFFKNSISNTPDVYDSFDNLLLHLNSIHKSYMIKKISNCIAFHFNTEKFNTIKKAYLINNIKILRHLTEIYKIDNVDIFIDEIFKFINEDMYKKYKANLEIVNTNLTLQNKNIQTIHVEKYIENVLFNYNFKRFLVNIEDLFSNFFYLNNLNTGIEAFKDDIKRKIKLYFVGKKYFYAITFISQKKFNIKKISYIEKDISSDFIPYPIAAYNNLVINIENLEVYNTHRALNWSLLDTALLFIGFKIYNTLFYGENKKFIFYEIIKDVRFAFIGIYSSQQLYDRHKWVLNKNRTSDSLRNAILGKIKQIEIENISIEEIILQIQRKKRLNDILEIENDLKHLYLYYSCFGHYLIKNRDYESLYDFINCKNIIIRKKENFIYYKAYCNQNNQLALVQEPNDSNFNVFEGDCNTEYDDIIDMDHTEVSVIKENNIQKNNFIYNLSLPFYFTPTSNIDNTYINQSYINISVGTSNQIFPSLTNSNQSLKTSLHTIQNNSKTYIESQTNQLPPSLINNSLSSKVLIQSMPNHLQSNIESLPSQILPSSLNNNLHLKPLIHHNQNNHQCHIESASDKIQQSISEASSTTSSPNRSLKNNSANNSPDIQSQPSLNPNPINSSLQTSRISKTQLTKFDRSLGYLKKYMKYRVHGFSIYDLEKAMHTKKKPYRRDLHAYIDIMIERGVIVSRSVTSRSIKYFFR